MLEVCFKESAKYSRQISKKIKQPENIISLDCYLDIGNISKGIDGLGREMVFKDLFNRTDLVAQQPHLEKIIDCAKTGSSIRIWKSQEPSATCGFAYLCDELRAIDCEISVVSLPDYIVDPTDTVIS